MKYKGVTTNFSQASKELTHWLKSLVGMVVNFGKTSLSYRSYRSYLTYLCLLTPLK